MRRVFVLALIPVLAACGSGDARSAPSGIPSPSRPPIEIVVLADATFAPVLGPLATAYETSRTGVKLVIASDATPTLQERIKAGAPADVLLALGTPAGEALATAGLTEGRAIRFAASASGVPCVAIVVTGGERVDEGHAFAAWLAGAGAARILTAGGFGPPR